MHLEDHLKKGLYRRSGGTCECTSRGCKVHPERRRCINVLYADSWKPYKPIKKSSDTLRNILAVCPACHKELAGPKL